MNIKEIRDHLSRFSVGIAGAGGLGSNCAAILARCGIGRMVIADFDSVEESNLSRQFYFSRQTGMKKSAALKENLLSIDSSLNLEIHDIRLTAENIPLIYSSCNVIVEAFDRAEMKEMIITAVQTKLPGVPVIAGSGMAGWGATELLRCRKIDDTLYVCGDESTEVSDDNPPLAPRVGIVAAMQANTVLEILMKLD